MVVMVTYRGDYGGVRREVVIADGVPMWWYWWSWKVDAVVAVVVVHDGGLLVIYIRAGGESKMIGERIIEMKSGRSNCNRSNAAVKMMMLGDDEAEAYVDCYVVGPAMMMQ